MGLALGEATVAKGVCTHLLMCFVMKAPLLQEFLTLEGEWFTDSLEMLAKTIDHLSRKMYHAHQIFTQSIRKWLVKDRFGTGCWSGGRDILHHSIPCRFWGGPEPGDPGTC